MAQGNSIMKYIYLTENGTADNTVLPDVNNDAVQHLAFLDVKTFKKLRKKIKTRYAKQAESKDADKKIVIIYSTPAAVISSGLRSQIEPTEVVAQWCQQAEALVELFKQYQSHCILANLDALKADMTDLVKLVRMNKKERAIFNAISTSTADADMYTLSAHYMISNDEQLNRQLNILDACTTFNEFAEDTCNIQSILNQQQAEVTSVNQKLADLSNQLTKEKDALTNSLKSAQTDLANQTEENKQIIKQLHLVQEAFEESILSTNKLKSDISALEKQLERSENHQAWLVKELLDSHEVNAKSWSYRSLMKKKIKVIKESGLFDETWYLETYPEAAASKINPILHYLLYGAVEGKNPSPEFNTKNYLSIYFDVASHGMNPFIHYINFGKKEGRKADPLQKRLPSPKIG